MSRLSEFVSRQLRRPSGFVGRRVMPLFFNRRNRPLILATLQQLELRADTSYLDVGFGGGLALRLASDVVADAPIYGTDYAQDVVEQAEQRFSDLLGAGRLTLLQGDISAMPMRDAVVDRISTTNTIYFWPNPALAASELLRLLTPGGRLAIGYSGADKLAEYGPVTEDFVCYRTQQVEHLLAEAGFAAVRTEALEGKARGEFVTVGERTGAG